MKILAIGTSGKNCTIAISEDKKLIKEINREAKNIVPEKKEISKKQDISPATQTISIKQEPEEVIEEEEVIEILQDDNESDVDRILKDIKNAIDISSIYDNSLYLLFVFQSLK